jgi:hypothetical protein
MRPATTALLAFLAYLVTVAIAVSASLSHPAPDGERHFVRAVVELGSVATNWLRWP